MTVKSVLMILGGIACAAAGFLAAQQIEQVRCGQRTEIEHGVAEQQGSELRSAAEQWSQSLARTEGEAALRAFAAGVAPAVMAQRHETIEMAAVSLLRIPGVSGIHVLGPNGEVRYSSDAKLTTTGNTEYRGAWALAATEFASRDSARPGILDYALPLFDGDKKLAVVWLEFDVAHVRDEARPRVLHDALETQSSASAGAAG